MPRPDFEAVEEALALAVPATVSTARLAHADRFGSHEALEPVLLALIERLGGTAKSKRAAARESGEASRLRLRERGVESCGRRQRHVHERLGRRAGLCDGERDFERFAVRRAVARALFVVRLGVRVGVD